MDFGKLRGILVERRNKFCFAEPNQDGDISLKDGEMSVNLIGMPKQSLAVKMPMSQESFFEGNFSKACDYCVVAPQKSGDVEVFLCEMKTTLSREGLYDACLQLKCSIPLFVYIKEALHTHRNESGEVRLHFAIIASEEHKNMQSIGVTGGQNPDRHYEHEGRKINLIVNYDAIPLRKLRA